MPHFRMSMTRQGVDLRKVPDSTRPFLRTAAQDTIDDMIATAKRRAPVRTGHLRRNITGALESDSSPFRGWVGVDESVVPYWKYPEYGTVHMAARPYLRPTVAEVKPRVRARVLEAIELGKQNAR
jgi:HK97 gp10 family phage protein